MDMNANTKNANCPCTALRAVARLDIQYAHRFYGFKDEARYLHGHTGGLTLEVGLFCIMGHGHRNGKRRTSQLSAA